MPDEFMMQMMAAFRQEAAELFDELDSSLLALDDEPKNAAAINRVFRAMHTIKGTGATAGFDQMSHFAHGIEDVFNQAREGRVEVTSPLVDSALRACDVLKLMLNVAAEDVDSLDVQASQILVALRAAAGVTESALGPKAAPKAATEESEASGAIAIYNIIFRPKRELFFSGADPVLLLDELRQLGELNLTAHFDEVPALEEMDPELCYTWWSAVFTTTRPLSQLQSVFEFVQDDCQIQLDPFPSPQTTVNSAPPAASQDPKPAVNQKAAADAFQSTAWQCLETIESCLAHFAGGQREMSIWKACLRSVDTLKSACEFCGKTDLAQSLASQSKAIDAIVKNNGVCTAEVLNELARRSQGICEALDRRQQVKAAREVEPPAEASHPAPAAPQTIRIDQVKLDRLMRAVGELLVARGAFPTLSRKLADEHKLNAMAKDVRDAGASITRIADELQESVMSMRMLPIKTTLQRFPRLIRDMSRNMGKNISFVVEGEETELDKAVIEPIGDALVHLIRNSADHGIEAPEMRAQQGKPLEGLIKIRAFNEGSRVVFEVSDDGKGLNTTLLKRKAVEKGLLTEQAAAAMSEQQAFELIFLPGFSMAEKVTDVSGRGVGMDVVRSNVRALHGTVEIASQLQKGTLITIRLPTSLMVSKGILFRAGGEDYIIPMDSLVDMTKVPASVIREYQGQRLAHIRGEVYQLISMVDILASTRPGGEANKTLHTDSTDRDEISIAIVQHGKSRYGIIVDQFVGQVEVIIKPLTGGLGELSLFSGATILGDGRIVLVINAMELPRHHQADGNGSSGDRIRLKAVVSGPIPDSKTT